MTRYDYRISSGATTSHGTGTLTNAGASTTVSGNGTAFLTQLHIGDIIICSGQTLCVASIADDTTLTLVTATVGSFNLAPFDFDVLVNVEALSTGATAPRSLHRAWEETRDTGDGLARGLGRPACTWNWGFISRAQRDALRIYCTGKSARVYIRTRANDSTDGYVTYQAAMLWPDNEDRQTGRRLNFTLEFRDMVKL